MEGGGAKPQIGNQIPNALQEDLPDLAAFKLVPLGACSPAHIASLGGRVQTHFATTEAFPTNFQRSVATIHCRAIRRHIREAARHKFQTAPYRTTDGVPPD